MRRRSSGRSECPDGPAGWGRLLLPLDVAWQAVEYAAIPPMRAASPSSASDRSARCAAGSPRHRGAAAVFGIDLVPERLAMALSRPLRCARGGGSRASAAAVDEGAGPTGHRCGRNGGAQHPLGKLAQLATLLPDHCRAEGRHRPPPQAIDVVRRDDLPERRLWGGKLDPIQ